MIFSLFVGRGAPYVTVVRQRAAGRFIGAVRHFVLQYPLEEAVGIVGMFHRQPAGPDELVAGGDPGELQYALAAPVELFGVPVLFEQGLDIPVEFLGVVVAPLHVVGGAALFVISVVGAKVFLLGGVAGFFEAPRVYGDRLSALAEDPDDATGVDDPDLFADMRVGHAIVVLVAAEVDMVVVGHLQALVVLYLEVLPGQGKQGVFLVGKELLLPGMFFSLHPCPVMGVHLFFDRIVERGKAEEPLVAQLGVYTGIDELYLVLDKGLVLRPFRPCGGHGGTVMVGQVLQHPVDARLVPAGLYDSGLQVVGDKGPRGPAHIFETALQGVDEIVRFLARDRHREAVVRVRQAGHEDLYLDHLAGLPVDVGQRRPGKVDVEPVAREVFQHHGRPRRDKVPVEYLAELAIGIVLPRMLLPVLLP